MSDRDTPDAASPAGPAGDLELAEVGTHADRTEPTPVATPFALPDAIKGHTLEFCDVTYKVQIPKYEEHRSVVDMVLENVGLRSREMESLVVLDSVSGILHPNELTLVLGSPGSGKSSLLKVLANHLTPAELASGWVRYGGVAPTVDYNNLVGLVEQEDQHFAMFTVRETLLFSARVQHAEEKSEEEINTLVDTVLAVLGLTDVQDTIVGDDLIRGISGGQKRRLTIGCTMVKNVNTLLLDEVTTGLDSATSLELVRYLRGLADGGRGSVCALLQPSKEIFDLCDRLIVLSRGKIAYNGPRSEAVAYFRKLGYSAPVQVNPAEFLAQVVEHPSKYVSRDVEAEAAGGKSMTVDDFAEAFRASAYHTASRPTAQSAGVVQSLDESEARTAGKVEYAPRAVGERYKTSLWTQSKLLLGRAMAHNLRNPDSIGARMGSAILTGLISGILFLQMGNSMQDARDRLGALLLFFAYAHFSGPKMIPVFLTERSIVEQQRRGKWYRAGPGFVATFVTDIPFVVLEMLFFQICAYFMMDSVNDGGVFFTQVFVLIGSGLLSTAVLRLFSVLLPNNLNMVNNVGISVLAISFLFCGYFIAGDQTPVGWIWLYWALPTRYSLEALVTNQMTRSIECTATELVPPTSLPNFSLPPPAGFGGQQVCLFDSEETMVETELGLEYGDGRLAMNVLVSYAYVALVLLLAFFVEKKARGVYRRWSRRLDTKDVPLKPMEEEEAGKYASQGVHLAWRNLSYYVPVKRDGKKEELQLLDGLSGFSEPGRMIALMGESGAGKTTLLDVLAMRKTVGRTEGEVLINGKPITAEFSRQLGYVEQQDIHTANQTVREALEFSARCRLPPGTSEAEVQETVNSVLEELEMENMADNVVGDAETGGLSREQRKRLTIAVELVSKPDVLFLDEPTTSLDAYGAALVMRTVRRIASHGRTVICTIHQPSTELFLWFDFVYFLRDGGRLVYFGPIGEGAQQIVSYFQERYKLPFDVGRNPADYILEVIARNRTHTPHTVWEQSDEANKRVAEVEEAAKDRELGPPRGALGVWPEFKLLIRREVLALWRDPLTILIRLGVNLVMGFVIGSLFFQLDKSDRDESDPEVEFESSSQADALARVSCIFFAATNAAFMNQAGVATIVSRRAVFYRETFTDTYNPIAYYLALVLGDMPFAFLDATASVIVFYWLAGFRAAGFGFYYLCVLTMFFTATSLARLVATYSPNAKVANAIAPVVLVYMFVLGGFVAPTDSIPWVLRWYHYLSIMKYFMSATLINEVANMTFDCERDDGFAVRVCQEVNGVVTDQCAYACPLSTGQQILERFDLDDVDKWDMFAGLLCVGIFFNILTVIGLRYYRAIKR